MTRWEDESNVYERCDTGPCADSVKCSGVEWMERKTYSEVVWL